MEKYFQFTFLLFVGLPFGKGFGSMTENQKDIALLHTNPGQLVVKYQVTIGIIVQKRMINTGFYPYQEKEELCQEVSLRLLEKTDEIKRQYDADRALFLTFFSLKVVNLCHEILRRKKREPFYDLSDEGPSGFSTSKYETELTLLRLDEFAKLKAIFVMYYRKRAKIELCLQIIYRIPALFVYYLNYCKRTAKTFNEAVTKLLPFTREFTDKEIFQIITPYLNNSENKNNSDIAVQRWMNNIINDSIVQLNVGSEPEIYDKEMFRALVEEYYHYRNKDEKNSIIAAEMRT